MTTVQCPICYCDYESKENFPRYSLYLINSVLLCGHTFCSSCIPQIIKQRRIKCPICSSITRFPPDSGEPDLVNCLVGNFTLLEALNVAFNENDFEMPDNQMCIKMIRAPMYEI